MEFAVSPSRADSITGEWTVTDTSVEMVETQKRTLAFNPTSDEVQRALFTLNRFASKEHRQSLIDTASCFLCEFERVTYKDPEPDSLFDLVFRFREEINEARWVLLRLLTKSYRTRDEFISEYERANRRLISIEDRATQRWILEDVPLVLSQVNRTWTRRGMKYLNPAADHGISIVRRAIGPKYGYIRRALVVLPSDGRRGQGVKLYIRWVSESTPSSHRIFWLHEKQHGMRWVFLFTEGRNLLRKNFVIYQHWKFWNVFVLASDCDNEIEKAGLDFIYNDLEILPIKDTAVGSIPPIALPELESPVRSSSEIAPSRNSADIPAMAARKRLQEAHRNRSRSMSINFLSLRVKPKIES